MGMCGSHACVLYDIQDWSHRCGDGLKFYYEETDLGKIEMKDERYGILKRNTIPFQIICNVIVCITIFWYSNVK